MGASAGNDACICNVLRLSLRYANLTTLEEGYGINLLPLATFALDTYGDDPCEEFMPRLLKNATMDEKTRVAKQVELIEKNGDTTIIEFKNVVTK